MLLTRYQKTLRTKIRELVWRETDLTAEEKGFLEQYPAEVKEVSLTLQNKLSSLRFYVQAVKGKSKSAFRKSRMLEAEDDPEELHVKLASLAALIQSARHVVFYTGAGTRLRPLTLLFNFTANQTYTSRI